MSYTRFNTERLIAEIQCRPCIWNTNLEDYSNRVLKAKAWEEIAEVLFDDWMDIKVSQRYEKIKDLQKKWKGLRDYHSRKKIKKEHDPTRRKRKAPFLELLSFLSVTKNPNQTSNMSARDEADMPSAMDSEESQSSVTSLQEQETEIPTFPEVLLNTNEKRMEYDADKSFLMSILPDMKSMTRRQNFEFRYEVMKLIKNMRYNEYDQS